MRLTRRDPPPAAISVVSMIDVLMIMLIFFMVTSTFLDLDMIPLVDGGEARAGPAEPAETLLIRLGADGLPRVRGAVVQGSELTALLADRAGLSVVILPSGQGTTQALVSVMESVSAAGIAHLRILRLEAAP